MLHWQNGSKDIKEVLLMVFWEVYGDIGYIDDPSKAKVVCVPGAGVLAKVFSVRLVCTTAADYHSQVDKWWSQWHATTFFILNVNFVLGKHQKNHLQTHQIEWDLLWLDRMGLVGCIAGMGQSGSVGVKSSCSCIQGVWRGWSMVAHGGIGEIDNSFGDNTKHRRTIFLAHG